MPLEYEFRLYYGLWRTSCCCCSSSPCIASWRKLLNIVFAWWEKGPASGCCLPAAEAILWWWWWWCTGEGDVWQKDRQAVRFQILFGTRTRRDIIAWFLCPRLSRPFHVHLNHQLLLPWSKAEAGHRTRSFSGISHWIHASFPFLYLPISTSSCFRVESQWIWTFARSRRPDPTTWQAK